MADDDIKKDADNQRKKPGPSKEEASSEEQSNILNDIKESLIGASSGLGEGANSAHLEKISKNVLRIADLQQIQYENNLESLKIEKDRLEGSSVKALDEGEERREQLDIFKEIRDSLKKGLNVTGGTGASAEDGKKGGFLSGLFGGKGGAGTLGIGYAAKGIGTGIAAAAGGIGALLLALAGADAIAAKFGNEGKSLKNVLINLGEGLAGMGTTGLVALGSLFAMSSVLAMFPGNAAVKAGLGIGAFGAGIAAFFGSLGIMEKGLDWMGTDYSSLKPLFKNFSDALSQLDARALKILGVLFGSAAILAMFPGNAGLKAGIGIGAIGAGIGAFFLALGATDAGLTWMNTDGTMLVTQVKNMTDAFGYLGENKAALKVLGGLMVAGAIFGVAPGGMKRKGKAVLGMGLIGMGIGAFFGGLATGDAGMAWMNSDGSNLKAIMINIVEGLSAFTGGQLAGLFAVGGIFAAVSASKVGLIAAAKATVGLGLAGLGIGAFISGIAVGGKIASWVGADGTSLKDILTNMAGGLSAFNKINSENLMSAAYAIGLLGPAMLSLLTGKTVTAAANFVGDVWDAIWNKDAGAPDQIDRMVTSIMKLEPLGGPKMTQAAVTMDSLSKSVSSWGMLDSHKISENAKAAVAQFEVLEKVLVGGEITQLKLEPTVTFKGILNMDGVEDAVAAFTDLAQNSLVFIPNTGAQLTAAGNPVGAQQQPAHTVGMVDARSTMENKTLNNSVTNVEATDTKTLNSVYNHYFKAGPGGQ